MASCEACGTIEWFSKTGPIDHSEAIADLFGSYDLIGPLDALAAPAPQVLAYAPPNGKKRKNLAALPEYTWLKAGPRLWLSHDGEVLLLATTQPLLFENLVNRQLDPGA